MFTTTCFDVWRQEKESRNITTLWQDLDNVLNGGIAPQLITELCGAPGSGKTQMCLQLSINVQLPTELGGCGGKAIYVDTNQGFHPERLKEIAETIVKRFDSPLSGASRPHATQSQPPLQLDTLLRNVAYIYCTSCIQLVATVCNLRQMLNEDVAFKLIVIDSFSFLPRRIKDVSQRTRIVYELLTDLHRLALDFNVAIVITNELTTRVLGAKWKIVPALGDSYTHKLNQRIILSWDTDRREALVDKCVMSPKVRLPFCIKTSGIRGCF